MLSGNRRVYIPLVEVWGSAVITEAALAIEAMRFPAIATVDVGFQYQTVVQKDCTVKECIEVNF